MKNVFIILCLTLCFTGCKTVPVNQKENKKENKKRVGLWIEESKIDSTVYKTVGKYKNDEPVKKMIPLHRQSHL